MKEVKKLDGDPINVRIVKGMNFSEIFIVHNLKTLKFTIF